VTAVSVNNSSFSAQTSVAVTDLAAVWTYHNDQARTGQNLQEYALTPSSVSSGQFGKRWSCAVDGDVYAQPLYVANVSINGQTYNALFVATQNDSVYAFNADDPGCGVLWHVNYLSPPTVTTSVPQSASCQDTGAYGITPTPVIDTSTGTMYVVVATTESGSYIQRLHALNIASGADSMTAVLIQGSVPGTPFSQLTDTFDPSIERPRAAMALSGGGVFISWASFCDTYPWQGWMMRYNASTLTQTAVYNTDPNGYGGGIWMSGGAPAIDSGGSMYFSTGNGTFDDTNNILPPAAPNNDFGESVVKLDPSSLTVTDFFTPSANLSWSQQDLDISAAGVTVLPDGSGPSTSPNLIVAADKQGHVYVIDRDPLKMSEFNSSLNNVVQYLMVPNILSNCFNNDGECIYSTPSYYDGTLYLGSNFGPVLAYTLTGGLLPANSGTASPSSQTTESYGFPNPTASISASPSGNAIMWVLDDSNCGTDDCWNPTGAAILRAYDATNLAKTLYSSQTLPADQGGTAMKFTVPVVANGHVYVAGKGVITVYGLAP
jgi:hypothetical protein